MKFGLEYEILNMNASYVYVPGNGAQNTTTAITFNKKESNDDLTVILGVSLPIVALILIVALFCIFKKRK